MRAGEIMRGVDGVFVCGCGERISVGQVPFLGLDILAGK